MEWKPYLFKVQPVFEQQVFDQYARQWGVQFPPHYLETVRLFQGMIPQNTWFPYYDTAGQNATTMGPLFHFVVDSPVHSGYNIMANYQVWKERLPEHVIPFSEDPGGWPIAFDFRNEPTEPSVILVDGESGLSTQPLVVAASFEKFLSLLQPDE